MPTTRRRRRIRIGMIGAASLTLGAAGIAGAMGWMVGGTTAAIKEYDEKAKASTTSNTTTIVTPEDASSAQPGMVPVATPALPADAWIPQNNAIQWATPIPPGTPLSGLSVRNGDQDVNLIAHLAARATNGAWIPVASMTVTAGREAILHPPAGDYSMTLVAAPKGMAFDQIAGLKPSPATLFRMDPVPQPASGPEPVRFSVSEGIVRKLPQPIAATRSTQRRSTARADAADEPIETKRPTMTITPAAPKPEAEPEEPSAAPVDDAPSDDAGNPSED